MVPSLVSSHTGRSLLFLFRASSIVRRCHSLAGMSVPGDSASRDSTCQTYEEAICSLNRLQSNASAIESARKARAADPARNRTHTRHYLTLLGITDQALRDLRAIHVAGTKGKGSTCVFTEAILQRHGLRTGCYTSPHLCEVRERIRINGQPVAREFFAFYFWQTYNTIQSKADQSDALGIPALPSYFMFLTVMAFNVFVREGLDVAIVEVGIGGEFDCTNFLKEPAVVGITSLGLDHVELLGSTIEQIAWQKSGILKAKINAFTVQQPEAAVPVLEKRAVEKGCQLIVVPPFDAYQLSSSDMEVAKAAGSQKPGDCSLPSRIVAAADTVILGIPGDVQRVNASLAIQLSHSWLKCHSARFENVVQRAAAEDGGNLLHLTKEFVSGLSACHWPGRAQILRAKSKIRYHTDCSGIDNLIAEEKQDDVTYFLDGAHTKDSINFCIDWFKSNSTGPLSSASESTPSSPSLSSSFLSSSASASSSSSLVSVNRILLFNCTGYRNPIELLTPLLHGSHFDAVLFSPNKVLQEKKESSDQSNFMVDPESEEKKAADLKNIWISLTTAQASKEQDVNGCDNQDHFSCRQRENKKKEDDQVVESFTCLTETIDWIQRSASRARCRDRGVDTHVLVTGSLHLVGGVLRLIDPRAESFNSAK